MKYKLLPQPNFENIEDMIQQVKNAVNDEEVTDR